MESVSTELASSLATKLIEYIAKFDSVAIAFSGGVDSAVVAAASYRAIGDRAVAVTGVGTAVATSELETARLVAAQIGISHREVSTSEIEDADYVRNDAQRCYYCKTHLYSTIRNWAAENGVQMVLSGTNLDDLGDYRPGLKAADEHGVVAPLVACSLDKNAVRLIAKHFGLSVSEKPASPCLASRIAYGQAVTPTRLNRVEMAEQFLKELGFHDVRVRLHADELARIELNAEELDRASESTIRNSIYDHLRQLGFQYVTMDLKGRQSGSMNRSLPVLNNRF
jgi:uncharacterized protein